MSSKTKAPRKSKTSWAGGIVLFTAAALAAGVFGLSALRAEANGVQSAPPPLPVSAIEVLYANNATIDEQFPGLISARRESALGFERGGRIDRLLVDVGDRVESGQELARLDLRVLNAQVAAADAQTAEAAAQTALARDTQERQQTLLERGHISPQRYDEVATTTRAAEARQRAAAAAADALRVQLDLAVLEAPFDGVVTARYADEGAIASPGMPVLDLVEADALEVRIGLPGDVAARLNADEVYTFRSERRAFEARLRATTGVVDRQTRTVTAVFDLDADSGAVAGEVARLSVPLSIDASGFWVPTSALVESRRGLWSVYVLQPENGDYRLEARVVETVRVETERVFVRGAVAEGEYVLSGGISRVTPGQLVAFNGGSGRSQAGE
ncbi:efflux RND transporter periplasmic adaptor subunit [Maricaulis sp.]|uniref:efflux RND transporter periplasmic adaptor subunit n=1 Tax=Maricaulis sp. TaxID=1486257 RepID=UPI002619CD9E|nr:efflux RND transporter periplasmic adaptor subunit [Maricaulis sp.]